MTRRTDARRILAAGAFACTLPWGSAAHAQERPVELEGLVVTATPVPAALSALGTHVTLLDGEELRARGVARLTEALREVPGLVVVQNGPDGSVTSVFFRGGESDFVQVLVDGVQVNQPGGSFDFSGLTTEGVERVEIVRGPASALHGSDAVAGVIHIITRDGAGSAPASLTVQGGSHGRLDGTLSVAGGGDRASYGVTLARYIGDGILPFNNAHENSVLSGKAALRLDGATRARISGRIAERRYHFPTDGSGALADRNQFTFADESSLAVEVERSLGDRVQLRALASSYAVDGGTDDAPDGPADTLGFFGFQSLDSYRRSAVDVRANVALVDGVTATVGGEYEAQRVRSFNESLSEFGPSTGRSANDRDNRAAYLHLAAGNGALRGNAGVRYEDNQAYGGFVSWQAGASLRVAPGLRIRGAAGRGIKEPTFFETFATGFVVGNPGLDPEISTSWEVGAEQTLLEGRLAFQATWFQQRFRDLIQYTFAPPTPGGSNYYNVARAGARGLEASASLALGPVRIGADATWLDTEVTDAGFDEGAGASFVEGESLLRRPDLTLGLTVGWRPLEALRLDLAARRTGPRGDRDFTAWPAAPVELDAFTRVDVAAEWSVVAPRDTRPGLDLLFRVQNLGDADYQEVFGFSAPGRALLMGGRVTLAN